MALLISLSFIISSSTTMRISDALLHAQTENRRITPKKYLSVFFMKAPLDFIKDKMTFWGKYIFFLFERAVFRLKSTLNDGENVNLLKVRLVCQR